MLTSDHNAIATRLTSDSLRERRDALARLREAGPEAASALIAALGSNVPRARKHAARLLGELGDRHAAGRLADCLADASPGVRRAAAIALAATPVATAADALGHLLAERAIRLRRAARHALGALGPEAWPTVSRAACSPDWRARESALHAACSLGGPEAKALVRRLRDDPHSRVRGTARWVSRRLARPRRATGSGA